MLPGLVRLGLPVPLGGTSNHFPRHVLDDLGGWDAHNVTEDADLGIRIARMGGRVGILWSTTWEEAPATLPVWGRQRTRWMKGFMQTWLVHMRHPGRLWRELGAAGFLGVQGLLGGLILSSLIHPIFVGVAIADLAQGRFFGLPESMAGRVLYGLAAFNLLAGYLSGMALAGLAVARRGLGWLAFATLSMPFYWLMISVAAYRAAWQLVRDPFLWEKTPHSARSRRGGRADGRPPAG